MAYGDNRTQVATDDFSTDPFAGRWDNGYADWGPFAWGGSTYVQASASSTDCGARRSNGETYTADQYSKITINNLTAGDHWLGAACRMQDSTTNESCYIATTSEGAGGNYAILEINSSLGFATLTSTATQSLGNGDTLTLEAEGTALRLGSDEGGGDTQKLSTTDNTIASGYPGIYTWDGSGGVTERIDAWEGGNIGAVGGGGDTELVVADAAHGHTADNLSLIEQEVIAVADALHGHSADTIGLLQQNVLVVADALHDHAADNIVLNLTTPLVVADATHVHTADSLGLIQQNVLAVADAAHGHTAESVTLDTGVVLQVADAIHAHGVDNVALTQAAVLAIADALHAHAADNIVLSQQYSLSVADATHGHTVDNVTLSLSDLLTVADSFHAHTAETIALTQASVLVVSDALHAHLADMLSLQLPGFVPPRGRVLIVQGKNTTFVVTRGNRTFNA